MRGYVAAATAAGLTVLFAVEAEQALNAGAPRAAMAYAAFAGAGITATAVALMLKIHHVRLFPGVVRVLVETEDGRVTGVLADRPSVVVCVRRVGDTGRIPPRAVEPVDCPHRVY